MKRFFYFLAFGLTLALASCGDGNEQSAVVNNAANPTIDVIMARSSVRAYSAEPVSEEMMNTMLRAAMAAPSGMDVRPWSFVVLSDTSRYREIFTEQNFNLDRIFMQAANLVVFCADTTVTRPPRENPDAPAVTTPNRIWRDDMGACTENFLLAAQALGLGAVWTAAYPYHDRMDPIKEALHLPGSVVPYCVVAVGHPAGPAEPKDKWDSTRIHRGEW